MTYLKRLTFHVFMLVVGGGIALLLLEKLPSHIVIPQLLTYLLIALFMALSLAVSQLIVVKLFPFADNEMSVVPAVRKPTWAWLRPRGDGVRSGFPLNKDHMIVGREVQCQIMLNDASISRQHTSVTRLAEGYLLKDLGSSNGTYVNGHRIQEALLKDGDRISIGDCEFWFEAPADNDKPNSRPGSIHPGSEIVNRTESAVGFRLDPSSPPLDDDDDDDDEGTAAWHPRPSDL